MKNEEGNSRHPGRRSIETTLATAGRAMKGSRRSVNPPVHRASTFLFDTLAEFEAASATPFDGAFYGRAGTPTSTAFEQAMAELEGGYRSIATASGLAAISATLTAFLSKGDHALIVDTVYDPVRRFAKRILSRMGIEVEFYDPLIGGGIAALIKPSTKMVYLESPGTGTFEVQDVRAIAMAARARNLLTAIDNTWATPLFFRPLEHGVDISIHAATKYIVGHSDAMLGVVTMTEEAYAPLRAATQDLGCCAGSEEANLGLRGLRTLGPRMRQHYESVLTISAWLRERAEVARVFSPALPGDAGHAIWKRDFSGASGLFGIELQPVPKSAVAAMLDGYSYFKMGFSWGGFESLVLPTHPERSRVARLWDGKGPTLRFHAGLESVDDLIADLEGGFARLAAHRD